MYHTTFNIGKCIGRVKENMYSDQMSSAEAQAALATIEKAESETIASLRPPLWLITMISLLCGIFTFSFAVTEGENHWALGAWLSGIAVVLLVLFWMYSARLLGVRAPVLPPSGSGKFFLPYRHSSMLLCCSWEEGPRYGVDLRPAWRVPFRSPIFLWHPISRQ